MKRTATMSLVLALLAGIAGAETATPPPGWKLDEAFSRSLTRNAQGTSYFGAVSTTSVTVTAFVAQNAGLYVTRADARVTADQRDAAATRALFELVDGARRQGSAQIESSSQRVDPAARFLEAAIVWRDAAGVRQFGRTVVAGDGSQLVAVHGQCILPLEAAKDVEAACTKALTTLDHGIPSDRRVVLAIVDAPAETTLPPIPVDMETEQPRLGDGRGTPMAPMTIAPAKREIDRRPLYLGGGIVVLAALFWWNRRRRDRFDREDEPATSTTVPEPSSGDDDADDLQAAARGPAPKDES